LNGIVVKRKLNGIGIKRMKFWFSQDLGPICE